jgi:hypothetical protein
MPAACVAWAERQGGGEGGEGQGGGGVEGREGCRSQLPLGFPPRIALASALPLRLLLTLPRPSPPFPPSPLLPSAPCARRLPPQAKEKAAAEAEEKAEAKAAAEAKAKAAAEARAKAEEESLLRQVESLGLLQPMRDASVAGDLAVLRKAVPCVIMPLKAIIASRPFLSSASRREGVSSFHGSRP